MIEIDKLRNAELLFKFSLAVSSAVTPAKVSPLTYLAQFAFLGHTADESELRLTLDQEKWGAVVFEHAAIHLMAVQIDTALESKFGTSRFDNVDPTIRSACSIARLIRNAFAHDPFGPVWEFTPKFANQQFEVAGIVSLDTTRLANRPVERRDYGGPLALLRFLQFTIRLMADSGAKA